MIRDIIDIPCRLHSQSILSQSYTLYDGLHCWTPTLHPPPLSVVVVSHINLFFFDIIFSFILSIPTRKLPSICVSESWSPPLRFCRYILAKIVHTYCVTGCRHQSSCRLCYPYQFHCLFFILSYNNVSVRPSSFSTSFLCARPAAACHLHAIFTSDVQC